MRNSVASVSSGISAVVTLLGVLLIAPALGQEAVEPEETANEPETDITGEATSDAGRAPAVAESGAVLDYEPTESISEDLSVSFPVDI